VFRGEVRSVDGSRSKQVRENLRAVNFPKRAFAPIAAAAESIERE